ncbi:hypothetical protein NM208_g11205 [Fusarium decemcellulare]|uniref:Uncharacterized protein n=1 Tax=Fusarium decemcellulare TaxID=57161 RepID=A0ACC1RV55_9HYPO|nr:hypothetical protein NM208_g11205 [Fusarium decemcellulare]
MKDLIEKGLERTKKEARVKETINDGMQLVKNVKDIAAMAVKAEPTAAVAWVGITACMEIVTNPVSEPGLNRDGIKYVLERIEWYWKLAELLLDTHSTDKATVDLQSLLKKHILKLFKKLLLYEMQSVCLYNRHWAAVIVRDLFKTDDWQESIDSIKKAEDSIRHDINQQNHEIFKFRLASIDNSLQHLRQDVKDVELAVKEQTRDLSQIHHDDKDNDCLKQLYVVNPTTHKQKIQKKKGGLLKDSYRWILHHDAFTGFLHDPANRLLWINGDPGKGKTMLLCGIIDELQKESSHPVFYFFCEATQNHLRTTTSVLRGLLWLVCRQYPEAMSCVRATYDIEGQKSFEDPFTLKPMLERILQSSYLQDAVFIVDALDECWDQRTDDLVDREELIDLIVEFSVSFSHKVRVSLELNKDSVSRAVRTFIRHKVNELALKRQYNQQTKNGILEKLLLNANDTFLWVALVCKELARPVVKNWQAVDIIDSLGSGLYGIYKRMLDQILNSDLRPICQQILAIACVVYRSLSVDELQTLMPEAKPFSSEQLKEIIGECGSFLTIEDNFIYFVHQSARDFLLNEAENQIFPSGIAGQHRLLFIQSLEALKVLRRDLYDLEAPGVLVDDIPQPSPDPLSGLAYACVYWIDHLDQCREIRGISDEDAVYSFITTKFLNWLEALSLQHVVAEVVPKMEMIGTVLVSTAVHLIKAAPLQVYVSALIFSPTGSLIRKLFEHEEPTWIPLKPTVETRWDSCVQTVSIPAEAASKVALSSSGRLAAISFEYRTINIWDISWNRYIRSITIQNQVECIEFSPDDGQIAVGFPDGQVGVWNTDSGSLIHTFLGHKNRVTQVIFSPDGRLLASSSSDFTVRLWDLSLNHSVRTLSGHKDEMSCMSFSPDGLYLVVGTRRAPITIWNTANGECKETPSDGWHGILLVAFLPDGSLASAPSFGDTIDIRDLTAGGCVKILHKQDKIESIVSLREGRSLASSSFDGTIKIWDSAGACVQTLFYGRRDILSLAYFATRQVLAEVSRERTYQLQDVILKAWDLKNITDAENPDIRGGLVDTLVFSEDGQYLASRRLPGTVVLWDPFTGTCINTLEHYDPETQAYRSSSKTRLEIMSIVFSPNSRYLLSISTEGRTRIWDTTGGNCIGTFEGTMTRAFSPNSQWLALAFDNCSRVKIWDTSTRSFLAQQIIGNTSQLVFSRDGSHLALYSRPKVEVWGISTTPFIRKKILVRSDALPLVLSINSELMAINAFAGIEIWDLNTEVLIRTLLDCPGFPIALSADKECLLSYSSDEGLGLWDINTGACLQMIDLSLHLNPFTVGLDINHNFRLYTNCGALDLNLALKTGKERPGASQDPTYCGYGLSKDGSWLVMGRKRMVWLPPEYRKEIAIMGSMAAFVREFGNPIFMRSM